LSNSPSGVREYREHLVSYGHCPVAKCIDCHNLAFCKKDENEYDAKTAAREQAKNFCKCGYQLLALVDKTKGYCIDCDKTVVLDQ